MLVVIGYNRQAEIYAMRPDGSERRRLTNNSVHDTDPSWSPDGRQIVFVSMLDSTPGWPGRRPEIYVMNANGTGLRRLVQVSTAWHPRWSPDGQRISFEGLDTIARRFRPYVVNSDGSNMQLVADAPRESFHLEWSPDGTRFLFLSNRSPRNWWTMYTMRTDGTDEQQLSGNAQCGTNVGLAVWSPDGTRIAYSCDGMGSGIFTMNTNGTDLQLVTSPPNGTGLDGGPVWSPDGTQLAFTSTRDAPPGGTLNFPSYVWDVFVVAASGGIGNRITPADTTHIVHAWGKPN